MTIPRAKVHKLRHPVNEIDLHDLVAVGGQSLQSGQVIAVPTDTVYGIAGLAQNTKAVAEIYSIKGRNLTNPIAISVADIKDIYRWSNVTVSIEVLSSLLPGPVTVVLERSPDLNPDLNPGTKFVGIRIPDSALIRALCRCCDSPLALTSANSSGAQSTLAVEEFQSLWSRLDVIFDCGRLSATESARLGSTVVDLSIKKKFRIIRKGSAYQQTLDLLKLKHRLEEIPNY